MRYQRSFLKWAGNKYSSLGRILKLFPSANRYLEPFAGSATVFLNTNFPQSILSEANLDLIQVFTQLKYHSTEFIAASRKYFIPEYNQADAYYEFRDRFNHTSNMEEKASIFLYLNKHGYNGLCRYNSSGKFNVPFGHYIKPYFPENELKYFVEKSQGAEFLHADYKYMFEIAQPGDLIYCDPPYVPLSNTAKFCSYTRFGFTEENQIELSQLAMKASNENITVIISNHDTKQTREYYREAKILSFFVPRFISCKLEKREPVREIVAIFNKTL